MKDYLTLLIERIIGERKIIRINDLWEEVNEHKYGFNRNQVLKEVYDLGFKKKHVMLYDREGKSNTLICYVRGEFSPEEKPIINPMLSADELNRKYAVKFLKDIKDRYITERLPETIKIDPPFFDLNIIDGSYVLFVTREKLRELIDETWYREGLVTHTGVLKLVRTVGQICHDTYFRKNTYMRNEQNEPRARIEDKLIYQYTFK